MKRSNSLLAILASCLLLGAGPPAAAAPERAAGLKGCDNGAASRLAGAARSAGVGIDRSLVAIGAGHKGRHVVAPLLGVESAPAMAMAEGLDLAIAHLEFATRDDGTVAPLADGDYLLRVFADPAAIQEALAFTRAGVIAPRGNALLQVLSLDGEVLLQRPAHLQWVQSPDAPGQGLGLDNGYETIGGPALASWQIVIWVQSARSWRVCIDISW